jgi:hypothetical protein
MIGVKPNSTQVDISSCPIGGIVLKIDMHVALFDFID